MTTSARRLSAAESTHIQSIQGRLCRGCRTVFPADDIPLSFGVDERTRDGLTKLCLACLSVRDTASSDRIRTGRSSAQADYRRGMRAVRQDQARGSVEAGLAEDPPRHVIPQVSFPGYPASTTPHTPPRTSSQDALLTRLYGRLIDAPIRTWEELAGGSRHKITVRLANIGAGSLALIDEHLRAFNLDPLKP